MPIVAGLASKEVAGRLGVNRRTVEAHRATITKEMRARSLSDLVRFEIAAHAGGLAAHHGILWGRIGALCIITLSIVAPLERTLACNFLPHHRVLNAL